MRDKNTYVIEFTDQKELALWRRFMVLNVPNINKPLMQDSIELCQDFMKYLDIFNVTNSAGMLLKARIVSMEEMEDYTPDKVYGKVIMLNPMGLIFDEIMVNYLKYDLEKTVVQIALLLLKSENTIGNTFSSACEKNHISKSKDQHIKNIMAMNDHKYDFPGCFFPISRIIH